MLAPNLHLLPCRQIAEPIAGSTMKPSSTELLLALRSPTSGWLAAMVCALEEAMRDPSFSDHHRELVHQLLDAKAVPAAVAVAAEDRLSQFEAAVADTQADLLATLVEPVAAAKPARPKLTLVGSAAA
jgi:hypothetical protein